MKFLFFCGGSFVGGMESVTLTLMSSLRHAGHGAAAVVSGWNDGVFPQQLAEAGVPFRCIKLARPYLSKPLWTIAGLRELPKAAQELKAMVRDFQPDAIVHTDVNLALVALRFIEPQVQNLFHLHNIPDRRFGGFIGKTVMNRCRGCIAVSNFVATHFASVMGHGYRVGVVHNGVPSSPVVDRGTSDKVRIGIIGQLLPRKRHHIVVDAVAKMDESVRQQIDVRIYGSAEAEYAAEIRKRISDRGVEHVFTWMGFMRARSEIYENLDAVIAPSVDEPFGTTILEAGSAGLPVIAARSGGFPEMIVDGQTGILVAPDNVHDLAQAITRLVVDPMLRVRLGANGHGHIASAFSPEAMCRGFLHAVNEFGIRPGNCVLNGCL